MLASREEGTTARPWGGKGATEGGEGGQAASEVTGHSVDRERMLLWRDEGS